MRRVFGKLRSGLDKTRKNLVDGVLRVVGDHGKIDQDLLDDLEEILITGDVGVNAAEKIIEDLQETANLKEITGADEIITLLKGEMKKMLQPAADANTAGAEMKTIPHVILIVGVNGTGKTTTIGKLAHWYREQNKKVLLAAADTFRAAASEQLEIWAQRAHVDMIKNQPGADPAAVAFDAVNAAMARNVDVLIVDTAGRLHTKVNLMEELRKIKRVLKKRVESAPHEVLLVLDATTGQNAINQTRQFIDAVDVDGIVLTKLDGTAKGGIVLAIHQELQIPVKYIGLGEQMSDLEEFDSDEFVEALFQ